ncbi:MAG TPA: hypothetical protein VFU18_03310 [Actinomycetota bacterium]|nr:hypothetical protein [Actinomycetota bacterium]
MEEFDLDRYLRASKRVDLSGVTWERVCSHPVSESEARCLAYMMDIETHTSIYLRDLLATPRPTSPTSRRSCAGSTRSCGTVRHSAGSSVRLVGGSRRISNG